MYKYKITFKGYTSDHVLGMNIILQSSPYIEVLEINPMKETGYIVVCIKRKLGKIIVDTLKNADCIQVEEIE